MEYRLHQDCGKVLLNYRTGIASSTSAPVYPVDPTETCKARRSLVLLPVVRLPVVVVATGKNGSIVSRKRRN